MTAKDRHKINIISYLSDWENEWPSKKEMAEDVLNISTVCFYAHFTPEEYADIETEAYELRKKRSCGIRSAVMRKMVTEAKEGNTTAANIVLDRTEGKVIEKIEQSVKLEAPGLIVTINKTTKDKQQEDL